MIVPPLLFASPAAPPTFYVAVDGRDANPGTADAPWRTVQSALDRVPSGGRVVVRGGIYNERLTVRVPTTLVAAEGETPVIDGAGLVVPADDAALVLIKNVDRVTLSGFELRNFRTTVSTRVPAGILVAGKADGVALLGNHVHHIGNDGARRDATNAFGIVAYGNSKLGAIANLRIEGNEVDHTKTGWSETVVVNGNVDGFAILGNWVHDVDNIGIDCIGFEGTSPLKGKDQARNGLVAGNRVENVSSRTNPSYGGSLGADGIYVDGGTGIVIERNVVRAADIGIEVASERKGKNASNVIVRSNLVTRSGLCGLAIGGYDAKRGGTLNCTLANNTLVGNDATRSGMGEFAVQFNVQGATFANNVVVASASGVLMGTTAGKSAKVGLASNDNLFFAPGGAVWRWKGRSYASLAAFAAGAGLDARSRSADPRFADPEGGDFLPAFDSPVRDAGRNPGASILGALDLEGGPRLQGAGVDLGAYELAPRPVAVVQPTPGKPVASFRSR